MAMALGDQIISVNKPKLASEVDIVGKVTGEVSFLKNIKSGEKIRVTKSRDIS